jgi:hypothetical protein
MAGFTTATDYLTVSKGLSNDLDAVRYSQQQYIDALNTGLLRGFQKRPDFYRGGETAVPVVTTGHEGDPLTWPRQYAMELCIFVAGYVELIDAEGNEDQRAAALLTSFTNSITKPGG